VTSLLLLFVLAAPPTDAAQLIAERKFDEAIPLLRMALTADPQNADVAYDLALAYAATGRPNECVAVVEPLASQAGPHQADLIRMLGNCLDDAGDNAKAIETFRRGLAIAPNEPQLTFNLAVALGRRHEYEEARKLLEPMTAANPWHAPAFLLLARIYRAQDRKQPAVMAYLRAIALDPTGLATTSMPRVFELLGGRDETFEEAQNRIARTVTSFLASTNDLQTDYTACVQRPFFRSMVNGKQLDVFAGIAAAPLKLDGTKEWIEGNCTAIDCYAALIASQTKGSPVIFPR